MDNNTELTKMLLSQIKERDDMIKSLVGNMTKLSDAYIIKDKEKDKRHAKVIIGVVAMSLITICIFTCSYFFSSYNPTMSVNGDSNSTSTIIGTDNTNTQTKGGNE